MRSYGSSLTQQSCWSGRVCVGGHLLICSICIPNTSSRIIVSPIFFDTLLGAGGAIWSSVRMASRQGAPPLMSSLFGLPRRSLGHVMSLLKASRQRNLRPGLEMFSRRPSSFIFLVCVHMAIC